MLFLLYHYGSPRARGGAGQTLLLAPKSLGPRARSPESRRTLGRYFTPNTRSVKRPVGELDLGAFTGLGHCGPGVPYHLSVEGIFLPSLADYLATELHATGCFRFPSYSVVVDNLPGIGSVSDHHITASTGA